MGRPAVAHQWHLRYSLHHLKQAPDMALCAPLRVPGMARNGPLGQMEVGGAALDFGGALLGDEGMFRQADESGGMLSARGWRRWPRRCRSSLRTWVQIPLSSIGGLGSFSRSFSVCWGRHRESGERWRGGEVIGGGGGVEICSVIGVERRGCAMSVTVRRRIVGVWKMHSCAFL